MLFACLLAAFVLMPLLELAVLLRVHQTVGMAATLAIVIVTGAVGAALARFQGLMTLRAIRMDLAEGRMPAPRLLDGLMILLAGALLITPGLVTDTIGFLLLVPALRRAIRGRLRRRLEQKLREGRVTVLHW